MTTLVSAFEVPPAADEAFLAGWARARDRLASAGAVAAPALHRALRADVPLRFVVVAPVESPEAWRAADLGAVPPFAAHPALYERVHEDGEPEGGGGAILIQPFEVPAGEDDRFLSGWERVRAAFAPRQGYLGTRLHRSLGPAGFRFVAIVRWSSPLMFARTLQQPEAGEAIAAMPFPGRPALYLVVRSDADGGHSTSQPK